MDPFLTLLHSFSSSLSESELSDLKFLCRDKIGKRKLECVRSGRELFSLLLEQRAIGSDSVGFLETMLRTIKREDLMVRLQQFVEGGEVNAAELPDANEKPIEVICENVGRDWKMLMRSLGFPEVKIERIVTAHPFNLYEQLIQSLQEWQKWKGKDAKVADLIKALRHCSMNLVADRVEQ
ncbi:FADD protein, partial [Casuarius casuarius]|nr:FADD protein [Casuarius casuarius]